MMGQRLGNEEVTITDRNQKILILVDHEHAQPGEMECIPHPDQFPLLIVHKARAAVGLFCLVNRYISFVTHSRQGRQFDYRQEARNMAQVSVARGGGAMRRSMPM